jgi:plasmid stabilization system protein ParE
MGAWRVALSAEAETDLERAVAFLAQKSQIAAERIGLVLVEVVFSLDRLPARGAPMRNRSGLRKIVHRHYLVIYRLHENQRLIEIVRVWDGRRDPARLELT